MGDRWATLAVQPVMLLEFETAFVFMAIFISLNFFPEIHLRCQN
jgi:hypothetical protein